MPPLRRKPVQPRGQTRRHRGGRAAPHQSPNLRRSAPPQRERAPPHVPHRAVSSHPARAPPLCRPATRSRARTRRHTGRPRRVFLRTGSVATPGIGGGARGGARALARAHGHPRGSSPARVVQRAGAPRGRRRGDFSALARARHGTTRRARLRRVALRRQAHDAHARVRSVSPRGERVGTRGGRRGGREDEPSRRRRSRGRGRGRRSRTGGLGGRIRRERRSVSLRGGAAAAARRRAPSWRARRSRASHSATMARRRRQGRFHQSGVFASRAPGVPALVHPAGVARSPGRADASHRAGVHPRQPSLRRRRGHRLKTAQEPRRRGVRGRGVRIRADGTLRPVPAATLRVVDVVGVQPGRRGRRPRGGGQGAHPEQRGGGGTRHFRRRRRRRRETNQANRARMVRAREGRLPRRRRRVRRRGRADVDQNRVRVGG